jgi:hypothetical protein
MNAGGRTGVESRADQRRKDLEAHLTSLTGFEKVSCLTQEYKLILEGCVETYQLKQDLATIAREHGFAEIDNCVRVYPCEQAQISRAPERSQGASQSFG